MRSCVNKPLLHAQIQLNNYFLQFVIQEFDVT